MLSTFPQCHFGLQLLGIPDQHCIWYHWLGILYLGIPKLFIMGYSLTNEKNSPGRITDSLSKFWLADSFFSWNHDVSAWKKQSLNVEMHLQKFIFIACDYLSIVKIGVVCHKTFTNAFIILLPWVKREHSYTYLAKVKKVHFWGF